MVKLPWERATRVKVQCKCIPWIPLISLYDDFETCILTAIADLFKKFYSRERVSQNVKASWSVNKIDEIETDGRKLAVGIIMETLRNGRIEIFFCLLQD